MVKIANNIHDIVNSSNIQNTVCSKISGMLEKMWVLCAENDFGNRSSTKTDDLHKKWKEILLESFGDYKEILTDKYELLVETSPLKKEKGKVIQKPTTRIQIIEDIFSKNFNVDMAIVSKESNLIDTVFLLKAPLLSINKNRFNSASNMFGEIQRFYGNQSNSEIELVFVNFTPNKTFTKHTKNKKITPEDVSYLGLNTACEATGITPKGKVIERLKIPNDIIKHIREIHIPYDIDLGKGIGKGFEDFTTIEQLNNHIVNNISKIKFKVSSDNLTHLKDYVTHCVNRHFNNSITTPTVDPFQSNTHDNGISPRNWKF